MSDASTFVTVFRGSYAEMLVRQSLLESLGFHPHIENQFMKTMDPFVMGQYAFEIELSLPAFEAAEAEAALREMREAAAAATTAEDSEEPEPGGAVPPGTANNKLRLRFRWGTLLLLCRGLDLALRFPAVSVFALMAYVLFGINYFNDVRLTDARPLVVRFDFAIFLALVASFLVLLALVFASMTGR
ncbi:MAG: hypothetical protein L0Z55_06940 [Planctomycetes bacterium]|nr:hypothetical protein [Planctomycetota bacterium]